MLRCLGRESSWFLTFPGIFIRLSPKRQSSIVSHQARQPLNRPERARRHLCGRLLLGLGGRGLIVSNRRVQTSRGRKRPKGFRRKERIARNVVYCSKSCGGGHDSPRIPGHVLADNRRAQTYGRNEV